MKPGRTGFTRLWHASRYSARGLRASWARESAFRQEVAACALLLPLAVWLGRNGVEVALLGGVCLLVLVVELLNTAVEAMVDRFGAEQHHLAGVAKDTGSAAVMIALVTAGFVWLSILGPRLIASLAPAFN